jgi:hypothetical protein
MQNGASLATVAVGDSSISISGTMLTYTVVAYTFSADAVVTISLDRGFIGEANNLPGYFNGMKEVRYSTCCLPTEESSNFTFALDSSIETLNTQGGVNKICDIFGRVLASVPCSKVDIYVQPSVPIITVRYFDLAYNSSVFLNADIREGFAAGAFSRLFVAEGCGDILPGSVTEYYGERYIMESVEVSLSPISQGSETTVTVTASLTSGFNIGDIFELYLPLAMQLSYPMKATFGNYTGVWPSNHINSPYYVLQGTTGTSIYFNTTGLVFSIPGDRTLTIEISQGVKMPISCSDFGPTGFISVYTFKRWDANYQHLLDFKVFDPANDGCASPAETVGVPDPDILGTTEWYDFSPTTGIQGDAITLTFSGLLFSNIRAPYIAKVAALPADKTCRGTALGTQPGEINPATRAITFVLQEVGVYDICIKHRSNWELAKVSLGINPPTTTEFLDILAVPTSASQPSLQEAVALNNNLQSFQTIITPPQPFLLEFSSCAALLKAAPAFCGCYLRGTSGNTRFAGVNLVASTSLNVEFMATIFGIFEQVRMGCCATNPYATETTIQDFNQFVLGTKWGLCM